MRLNYKMSDSRKANRVKSNLIKNKLSVYIAAPFTAMATDYIQGSPHGVIPKNIYRVELLKIEEFFKKLGFKTILPHKSFNKWGRKILKPYQVVNLCSDHIIDCDLFFGILSESHGTHYEFGLATGNNKPTILIDCKELPSSFIAKGFNSISQKNTKHRLPPLLLLKCNNIADLANTLQTDPVSVFIMSIFPGSNLHFKR